MSHELVHGIRETADRTGNTGVWRAFPPQVPTGDNLTKACWKPLDPEVGKRRLRVVCAINLLSAGRHARDRSGSNGGA